MRKRIVLTRDSVSIGDDAHAPHTSEIVVDEDARIGAILSQVIKMGYLPQIWGGKATWSVADNNPLAVIAQEWAEAKLIEFPEYPFQDIRGFNCIDRLHFNYFAQNDPDVVLSVLQRFKLPEE